MACDPVIDEDFTIAGATYSPVPQHCGSQHETNCETETNDSFYRGMMSSTDSVAIDLDSQLLFFWRGAIIEKAAL